MNDKALLELVRRLRNTVYDWEEIRDEQPAEPVALLSAAAELRSIADEVEALVVIRVNA